MQALILGLAALALALLGLNAYTRASPAHLARLARQVGGTVAMVGAAVLLVRGSFQLALPLAMAGLWLLAGQRLPFGGGASARPGQTSEVRTEHLEMALDHDTGEMRGRVLKGFFAGRRLETLRPVELAHLWQDCRFSDPASAQLVEAYLDRVHPTWREDMERAEAATPKGPDGRMTRVEALEILGLEGDPDTETIRRAHRELMLKLHPDRGGSTYLAAKVNEAKDVLLDGHGG
jgi:hypothetical protein